MSSAVLTQVSFQLLIFESTKEEHWDQDWFKPLNFPIVCTTIQSPVSLEEALRDRPYDLLLWRLSSKPHELEVLQEFVQRAAPLPPLIVVASPEGRSSIIEEVLLKLIGHGVRDFYFEDEPAVLRRAIHRSFIEQGQHNREPQTSAFFPTHTSWETLVEACPLAIVVLTPEGNVLLWNRSAERVYGWCREEVLGKPLPTIPAGSEEEFHLLLEAQLHGISQMGKEVRRRHKSGKLLDVSLWTAPLRDQQGHIRAKLAISADITEQHRAEQEFAQLVERERNAQGRVQAMERFRELLEAAPDAIVEVDAEGQIVLCNAVTERLFGYTRTELLGQSVDMLVPECQCVRHAAHRTQYTAHSVTRPMGSGLDLYGLRKDGTQFPVEISLSPVHSTEGFRVSAIIRDISERKQTEQQIHAIQERFTSELTAANRELGQRNREIEQANRLKSEFLASMSHELRTPLHIIIGFTELLAEQLEGPLNPKQKRFIHHIHKDSLHLLELINDILDLSKIEAGKLQLHRESFDAFSALEETLNSLMPLAAAKLIAVERHLCTPFTLQADRVRFKQILYNLLSNAVKFTPEGGQILIECSTTQAEAHFGIRDTGVGIPKEEQVAIFEKFHQVGATTKGVREGTGLGLAITKYLVEEQGGRLWVESQLGIGSRFCFTLPL